jgi:hypothetical protein
MGTAYTGVAANVSLAVPVVATVPADNDPDNAATFTVGDQKIIDYSEALRSSIISIILPTWVGSTAYTVNQIRSNGANVYICRVAGTSAGSGGPTGTGTGIVDNTVTWDFVAALSGNGIYSQTSGAAPGLTGEGGATAPGVLAIAGGGAAPARGAANLAPQAAPAAPANGDMWVETTSNVAKARINGATKTLLTSPIARGDEPSVGQQISASSGAFSNAGAAFIDVTNLSVTITTSGRPVVLMLIPDGSANQYDVTATSGSAIFAFDRGGSFIARWYGGSNRAMMFFDPVAAGTYTYKMRVSPNSASLLVNYAVLVAYEL